MKKSLQFHFESVLWQAHWSVLSAVFCSAATALAMFYVAAVDAYYVIERLLGYASLTDIYERSSVRANAIGNVVEVVDGFLLAIVLLIFAFGLYELYISKIDSAYEDEASSHMLSINSLDDLKSRLGKVILMILIVKFFELAISMDFETIYDLLMFSVGILIVGGSLFLTEVKHGHANNHGASGQGQTEIPEIVTEDQRMDELQKSMMPPGFFDK